MLLEVINREECVSSFSILRIGIQQKVQVKGKEGLAQTVYYVVGVGRTADGVLLEFEGVVQCVCEYPDVLPFLFGAEAAEDIGHLGVVSV